jgi:transposase
MKRHDVSRNLIRIWIAKYEAGAFDHDFHAAELLQEYEPKSPLWSAWYGKPSRSNF